MESKGIHTKIGHPHTSSLVCVTCGVVVSVPYNEIEGRSKFVENIVNSDDLASDLMSQHNKIMHEEDYGTEK